MITAIGFVLAIIISPLIGYFFIQQSKGDTVLTYLSIMLTILSFPVIITSWFIAVPFLLVSWPITELVLYIQNRRQ